MSFRLEMEQYAFPPKIKLVDECTGLIVDTFTDELKAFIKSNELNYIRVRELMKELNR